MLEVKYIELPVNLSDDVVNLRHKFRCYGDDYCIYKGNKFTVKLSRMPYILIDKRMLLFLELRDPLNVIATMYFEKMGTIVQLDIKDYDNDDVRVYLKDIKYFDFLFTSKEEKEIFEKLKEYNIDTLINFLEAGLQADEETIKIMRMSRRLLQDIHRAILNVLLMHKGLTKSIFPETVAVMPLIRELFKSYDVSTSILDELFSNKSGKIETDK